MQPTSISLAGKVAVVTGGASGIGLAITKRFAAHGAAVEIVDVQHNTIESVVAELKAEGRQAAGELCDVGDPVAVDVAFENILQRHGRLDILVNNAGIAHVGNALTTSADEFNRIMRVNVGGVANCSRAALQTMSQTGGVILNIASTLAQFAIPDRFAYGASKGAVVAMTYSIAKDFIHCGVRCNALMPGRIHTPFVDGFIAKNFAGREQEMLEKLSQAQPIGRMGTPDEVAAFALFLCSDEAAFVTGSAIPVDGGTLSIR
jgi:2-keto-3-deoxy-L-fuconate dehydrogenase